MILASLLIVNSSNNSVVNATPEVNSYSNCYSAGERAYSTSNFEKAAENFAQALIYKPDDLRARLKYGQALFSLNKYEESSQQLQRVLQNSPNNIIARIYLAENYIHLGKTEEAKEQLDWVLKNQPNHQKAKSLYKNLNGNIKEETKASNKQIKELPSINIIEPIKIEKEEKNKIDKKDVKEETVLNSKDTKSSKNNLSKNSDIQLIQPINADDEDNMSSEETIEIIPQKVNKTKEVIPQKVDETKEEEIPVEPKDNNFILNSQENNIEDNSILEKQDKSMTFTPYVSKNKAKTSKAKEVAIKNLMPEARTDITDTDMKSFFKAGKASFLVNLEKARFEIEKANLIEAEKTIEIADKLARDLNNSRGTLEAQIFKSLIYIYKCEFTKFGKHLMTLKPALSNGTYKSFLDIYSKSEETKDEFERRRLAASVAVGAGHYAVVVDLLKPVFEKNPKEPIVYSMLSDAQLNIYDYDGAEKTFLKFAEERKDSAEAQFNLARFYLTANYKPELAKKYANIAAELAPNDARNKIIIALTDYSQGKVKEGINQIKEVMPSLEDSSMKAICQRIVLDGEKSTNDSKQNYVSMLALPCSKYADSSSLRFAGEDNLKNGSYFSALEKFEKADDGVEMGRVYLGLASALTHENEMDMASISAGYGLKLINEDMSKGKNLARACLYKALYDYERKDTDAAIAKIDLGLNCKDLDYSTYNKLVSLYENLK